MDQRYDESEFWSTGERPTLSLPVIRRAHREGRAGLPGDPTPRAHYRVSPSHPTAAQFRRRRTGAVAGILAIALIGVVSVSGGDSGNGAAINPLAPGAPVGASSTSSTEATTESTDAAVDEPASQQADVAAQVVAPRAAAKTAARKTVAPSTTRKTTARKTVAKKSVAKVIVPTKRTTTTTDAPTTRRSTTTTAERRPSAARPTLAPRPSCRYASYRVRRGDSWIAIARKVTTNLNALLRVNGATARTPLFAGMTVCLPAKARPGSTTTTTAPGKSTTTTVTPKPTTSTTKPRPTTTAPKPTTTTTQPKPTTTVPRQNTYTRAEVQQIIREVWPDDQEDKAIAIAWRESNWVPTVRNYCCIGLFQIYWNVHKSWLIPLGVKSSDMLFDPRINATAALALYQRAGGWAPWNL